MVEIQFDSKYFNIKDTLDCGQIFRYQPYKDGYLVFSLDKACYVYQKDEQVTILCNNEDEGYFYNYFDLQTDYSQIVKSAKGSGFELLVRASELGKGVRILRQDKIEMLFSFIISQNNHIPRIKGIIERISNVLGAKRQFMGYEYFAFPTVQKLAEQSSEFYAKLGLGYRAEYISNVAKALASGFTIEDGADTITLKESLIKLHGVGPKVADCVSLFGYYRTDSFPVDTWIEKVYKQDFNGAISDRKKIAKWFVDTFGNYSGYFQQYLFYYKRSLENTDRA